MMAPLALGGGEASDASDSEEDDGEQDEFVYDIQVRRTKYSGVCCLLWLHGVQP